MQVDFAVLGAGMAGAAAGYFLAEHGSVAVLEREDIAGYHSTGRSAALYTETYGSATVRALTVASGAFFRAPPAGFAEVPLLKPRGVMIIARAADRARFAAEVEHARRFAPNLRLLDPDEARSVCPALREEWLAQTFLEPDAMDMDVHAIHQGFLRGLGRKGGQVITGAAPQRIARRGAGWHIETAAGGLSAGLLVNAAGAWADAVAALAGLPPLGLSPLRRTAILAEATSPVDPAWPLVCDIDESFYFKPESGGLLLSPADETPVGPSDAQPEELDVAVAIARVEAATRLEIRRVRRKWAGLRTFAPDRSLVIGPDPEEPRFLWMAGQGGYGIQTAPAAGAAAAALATGQALPEALRAQGIESAALLPERLLPRIKG
jgi:D-arginine dehydrogenase